MTTYSRREATARAKDAQFYRRALREDIAYAQTNAVDPALADTMRESLEFIIEQSHDTIGE